jgi:hypothetical protein
MGPPPVDGAEYDGKYDGEHWWLLEVSSLEEISDLCERVDEALIVYPCRRRKWDPGARSFSYVGPKVLGLRIYDDYCE